MTNFPRETTTTATATALFAHKRETQTDRQGGVAMWVCQGGGGLEKNKYIKMPAGKMKIQTNALIRDAETLLENVSRRWLLATAAAPAVAARGHSESEQ